MIRIRAPTAKWASCMCLLTRRPAVQTSVTNNVERAVNDAPADRARDTPAPVYVHTPAVPPRAPQLPIPFAHTSSAQASTRPIRARTKVQVHSPRCQQHPRATNRTYLRRTRTPVHIRGQVAADTVLSSPADRARHTPPVSRPTRPSRPSPTPVAHARHPPLAPHPSRCAPISFPSSAQIGFSHGACGSDRLRGSHALVVRAGCQSTKTLPSGRSRTRIRGACNSRRCLDMELGSRLRGPERPIHPPRLRSCYDQRAPIANLCVSPPPPPSPELLIYGVHVDELQRERRAV